MATKKNVDTSALFRNLIGDEGEKDTEPKVPEKKETDMENPWSGCAGDCCR